MQFAAQNSEFQSVSITLSTRGKDQILIEQDEQIMIVKRIDDQQEQLLEDLESLNSQIENIIELFAQNRKTESSSAHSQRPDDNIAA